MNNYNFYIITILTVLAGFSFVIFAFRKKGRNKIVQASNSGNGSGETPVSEISGIGRDFVLMVGKGMAKERLPLASLRELSKEVASTLTLQDLLNLIVNVTSRLLDTRVCSLMLLHPEKKELRILSAKGLSENIVKNTVLKVGEGIAGRVAESGGPLFVRDINKEYRFRGTCNPAYQVKCFISVPLTLKGKVIGVINVTGKAQGLKYTEDDLYSLMVIAARAAVAIENARMYKEITDKLKELSSLGEISKNVSETKELNFLLQKIVETAQELKDVDLGSLRLPEKEGETLSVQASVGLDAGFLKKVSGTKTARSAGEKTGIPRPLVFSGILSGKRDGVPLPEEKVTASSRLSFNAGQFETIETLALTMEARDPYTKGHSDRVTEYAVEIAKALNMSEPELMALRYAGRLHDIGKIAVKDDILSKQGPLTISEKEEIKLHSDKGAEIVGPLQFMKGITACIRGHHERYDGSGYPDGIKKEEIPVIARILAVADAYDAMTSDRPYRKSLDMDIALLELEKNSGTQFDPEIVRAFKKVLGHK